GGYYGYKAIGIYRDQEDFDNSPKHSSFLNTAGPGDIKYQDISGPDGVADGIIDDFDITYLGGGSLREVVYGVNEGIRYKAFELNFVFQRASIVDKMVTQKAAWAFYNSG